jgi:hypothetical protein
MKAEEFLSEFDYDQFPQETGPWIGLHYHDPPWKQSELKQMEKHGLIEFNGDRTRYRLTLKATKVIHRLGVGDIYDAAATTEDSKA